MIRCTRITSLVENTAGRQGVIAEHGLAFWIEADDVRVLFDTGQGLALEHNADALDVDLSTADHVVLSHGHYDHSGGLAAWPEKFRNMPVHLHPAACDPKYAQGASDDNHYNGFAYHNMDELQKAFPNVQPTPKPTEIAEGIWVTGCIPRTNDFEDVGGPFFRDEACTVPDQITDDQALYLITVRGVVVVLGCAHAGLVNTLDYISQLTGRDHIYAVIGGMHLHGATAERLDRTLVALDHYRVRIAAPCHCTGPQAVARILASQPDRFTHFPVGQSIEIG